MSEVCEHVRGLLERQEQKYGEVYNALLVVDGFLANTLGTPLRSLQAETQLTAQCRDRLALMQESISAMKAEYETILSQKDEEVGQYQAEIHKLHNANQSRKHEIAQYEQQITVMHSELEKAVDLKNKLFEHERDCTLNHVYSSTFHKFLNARHHLTPGQMRSEIIRSRNSIEQQDKYIESLLSKIAENHDFTQDGFLPLCRHQPVVSPEQPSQPANSQPPDPHSVNPSATAAARVVPGNGGQCNTSSNEDARCEELISALTSVTNLVSGDAQATSTFSPASANNTVDDIVNRILRADERTIHALNEKLTRSISRLARFK